jgi:hypothetical protein
MSKSKELMKKLFLVMVMLCMFATTITISTGKTIFAEESEETEEDPQPDIGDPIEADPAEDIYESITGMADTPPSDWYQEKDPYGYGLNNMFFLNAQQELLLYQYNGHSDKTIESYDTLKAKNESDYPLADVKPRSYSIPQDHTLSHAKTIAFDPTGSGRKDHIAVIGVYSSKFADDKTPPYIYVYVMDKEGHLSSMTDLGVAKWMCNDSTLNNDNMWDFNARNFMDITAGDFDGDGKDSLVVWACGSNPILKQVNVTSHNGSIALNVLDANGYASVPDDDSWKGNYNKDKKKTEYNEDANGLTHYLYYDTPDRDVENRLSVVVRSGDFNGDGVDDLAVLSYLGRVIKGQQDKWGYYYIPMLSFSYGTKGDTRSITAGNNSDKNIDVQDTADGSSHIAPMACGMAVGDIDNDGRDEAVISGIYHEVSGSYWKEKDDEWVRKEAADAYEDVDKYKLVTAIYRGSACLMFDKSMKTNAWTAGDGSASAGYYTWAGNLPTGDQSYQQIAVETVAINGKGSPEHIFISGDLYTYDGGKLTVRYQPDYFQHVNGANYGWNNKETYMRSVAVGNFDGNEEGREQVAFVAAAARDKVDDKAYYVSYALGIMGGVYEDKDGNPQPQAVSYYCSKKDEVLEKPSYYYPGNGKDDCTINDCLNFDLCAWDNDSDGLHVKYVGKEYTYTDPAVMAILQAPPYFEEVKGAMTDMSTSYSITTTYEYETSQGNSTSFGAGADFEVEAEVVKFNVSAGYATDWSESFSNSWTDSETYTLNAIGEDQVLLYRTPVTIYKYQVETKSGWSDKNIIELSFPGKSTIAPMSVRDYNIFAAYYNKKAKELAEEINVDAKETLIPDDKVPQLNLIEDEYLGNEGNPYAYMNTSSPLRDVTVLQKSPLPSGVGSSSMEYEWSREHATGYEESESHGFSFEFQLMFQFKIGHSGAALGGHVSLDYMRDFSTSRTEAKGIGASCAIGNLDPEALEEMGMSATAGRQYGFNSQLVTWDSDIVLVDSVFETSMESEFDGEFDDDENKRREMKYVPIFGYMLSGIKSATPPVTDLDCEFELDENEEMNILLTWSDPSTEYKRVGAYVIYQVQKDGSYKEIATLPADTTEYMFDDIDGRNEYIFVVRTKSGIHELYESVDSNKAYIYVEANALYSIELTSSDEDSDTYTITHTDGTKSYIVVKHGVSIIDIKKTGENGKYDTYTIYFSDGSTATYVVKNGEDGREIELRTYQPQGSDKQIIQWRYIGDEKWNDLVEVSNVAAIAGRKIELRINYVTDEATGETKGFIQWRYEGDGDDGWNNLIDIDELKGDKGDKGDQGEAGREVELQVFYYTDEETGEEKGIIQWRYVGDGDDEWRDLIASSDSALIQGEPGREVELKVVYYTDEETGEEKRAIQWRYVGDSDDSWTKLIDLSELKGDAGEDGKQIQLRYDDQVNAILWRYEGEDWQELVLLNEGALKGDKGDDGREILLNVDEDLGYIQWKYEGEDEWTNLIAIDKLKAAPAREIELQYDAKKRAVMWRYVGDDEWSDLFMIPTPSDGRNGHDGRGIVSVDRTARNGIIDTYTITYSDGTTSTFTVTNGTSSEHSYSTYTTYSTEHKSSSDQSSNSNTPSNNTTDPNQSNITYDNVGISNIKVDSNGDLIITLTDGSSVVVGNKEESKTDNQSMSDSGLLRTYYFNMPMSEFKSVNVDGKQIESDQYTVTSLGDGILVTIREEALGKSAKRMDVLGRSNVISSSLVNPSQSGFGSWTTILFGCWNTLLTVGLGILTSQFLKLKRSIR